MIKWLCFFLCITVIYPALASVEIFLQPNPGQVGQELKFIIKQKGQSRSRGVPDISALENDFQIIGTQQSMSYQFINGVSQHENIWTILLLPIHSGKIKIPSITIGGDHTPEQEIKIENEASVIKNTQLDAGQSTEPQVFMQWHIAPQEPVLHEAIKIKLDIYHSTPLLDAKLSLPKVTNGLLFSVDEPEHAVMTRHDKRYEIETYEYFVYPQKLGALTIHPPVLDALAYGLIPEPVHISLPGKILKVFPILPKHSQDILPAKKLEYRILSSQPQSPEINAGDAYTRTIRIKATGAPYHLIPDLNLSCGMDCKVYVKVKQNFNKFVARELQGQEILEITYIPAKQGTMDVPNIEIPWFNTEKRALETLLIPGFKMMVKPENNSETIYSSVSMQKKFNVKKVTIPTWLSVVLGLVFGAGLTFVYPHLKNKNGIDWVKQFEFKNRLLKKSCQTHQVKAARKALLDWGQKNFEVESIYELHDLIRVLPDGALKSEIQKMILFLYAKDESATTWEGESLWRAFKRFSYKKNEKNLEKNFSNRLNP